MSGKQIERLCFLSQLLAMGKLRKTQDENFIRRLERLDSDEPLCFYDSNHLNAVWLDNRKEAERLAYWQI